MAKYRLHPALEQIRGALGNLVFKTWRGRPYIATLPDMSDYKPTAAQNANRARFREATRFATAALKNPDAVAHYAPTVRQGSALTLPTAMRGDFLTIPAVESIDAAAYRGRIGDEVYIDATDRYGVVRVELALSIEGDEPFETGPARLEGKRWLYTTVSDAPPGPVRITARASDWPGNTGEGTILVHPTAEL